MRPKLPPLVILLLATVAIAAPHTTPAPTTAPTTATTMATTTSRPHTRPAKRSEAIVGLAQSLATCLLFTLGGTLFLIVLGVIIAFARRSRR